MKSLVFASLRGGALVVLGGLISLATSWVVTWQSHNLDERADLIRSQREAILSSMDAHVGPNEDDPRVIAMREFSANLKEATLDDASVIKETVRAERNDVDCMNNLKDARCLPLLASWLNVARKSLGLTELPQATLIAFLNQEHVVDKLAAYLKEDSEAQDDLTPTPLPPSPPPVPPTFAPAVERAALPQNYLAFFERNSSQLTERARQIVAEIAQNSARMQTSRIEVDGYADVSEGAHGCRDYPDNDCLSTRRADSVRAELVRDGVPPGAIEVHGYGDAHLLVPAGGSALNRRAAILLHPS